MKKPLLLLTLAPCLAFGQTNLYGDDNLEAYLEGMAAFSNGVTNDNYVLTDGGFTDWYLPSIDELSFLWYNRFIVNKALCDGGFTLLSNAVSSNYWSSTEHNSTRAQNFIFIYGYIWYNNKTETYLVRAVRAC